MTSNAQAFSSGNDTIQALLEPFSWTGTTGTAGTVAYDFGRSVEGGSLFGSEAQAAAEAAMQIFENIANVTFNDTNPLLAKLTFSQKDLGEGVLGLTTTLYTETTISSSEVQMDDQYTGNFGAGTDAFLTLLHEIGHALGLKHPGNYSGSEEGPFLSAADDTNDATIMSYNSGLYANANGNRPPVTPMVYDIMTLHYLYGANTSYNSGDTTYSYDGTSISLTLWDGGGTDTLSAASYTGGAAMVDLHEGRSNFSLIGSAAVWIAENAQIENATGSHANDVITGNSLANTIYGGTGLVDPTDSGDQIYGYGNSDALFGNGGNDTIYGGSGVADPTDAADTVYGGGGADAVYGNGGNDALYGGGSGVDPNDSADTVYGGGGADTILGNGGNDALYGGGSNVDPNDSADLIYGGRGDDYILGNGGNDTIYGGEDNDTLHAGVGDDVYAFGDGSGVDTILLFDNPGASAGDVVQLTANINGLAIAAAADVLAHISYAGGNAVIDLGSGNSITLEGISEGALTADDFIIA